MLHCIRQCHQTGYKISAFTTWGHHDMETISTYLALNNGNPPVTCGFPQRPRNAKVSCSHCYLTHCGLVTPYGDTDLGQLWLRYWLVAWWHQAITWTNVDLSSLGSSDFHLRATLPEIHQPSVTKFSEIITHLKFCSNLPGANELNNQVYVDFRCPDTHVTSLFWTERDGQTTGNMMRKWLWPTSQRS